MTLEEDVERLISCKTYEEFEELAALSPASPEAYWAEVAWRIAHAAGFEAAWRQR
jgi:hypothetical protein